MAQMGFFDLTDRYASLDAKSDPLVEVDAVVPWEEFRPVLEQVWRKPDADRKSRAGRKPMDAVLMFKTLVLSALYNLSGGHILDASIVPVPRNHNTRDENAAIKKGETPEDWENKPAKRNQKDVDAR